MSPATAQYGTFSAEKRRTIIQRYVEECKGHLSKTEPTDPEDVFFYRFDLNEALGKLQEEINSHQGSRKERHDLEQVWMSCHSRQEAEWARRLKKC